MKIGIITSWADLQLWEFLTKHDHHYVVYLDTAHMHYEDKPYEMVAQWIQQGKQRCRDQWCTHLILPPLRELTDTDNDIVPLFRTMCHQAFTGSLIGKIGLLTPVAGQENVQDMISDLSQHYHIHDKQRNTKHFHYPFVRWTKSVPLRIPLAQSLAKRDYLANKVVKHDLRYMKDAFVDTIIPCSYGFCRFDKTIQRYFNGNKQKYYGLGHVHKAFVSLTDNEASHPYHVDVHVTGRQDILAKKSLLWLMQRGKQHPLRMC